MSNVIPFPVRNGSPQKEQILSLMDQMNPAEKQQALKKIREVKARRETWPFRTVPRSVWDSLTAAEKRSAERHLDLYIQGTIALRATNGA